MSLLIVFSKYMKNGYHMSKILIVTAHPDDLEYFAGGFLLKAVKHNHEVSSIIITNGELSPKNNSKEVNRNTRRNETKLSLQEKVKNIFFLDLKDGSIAYGITKNKLKELNYIFEKIVHPDFVLTHNPNDYHSDHREIASLIEKIVSFKVPIFYMDTFAGSNKKPDFILDITEEFTEKCDLLRKHISQSHLFLDQRAEIINSFRGLQYLNSINKYGEAFYYDSSLHTKSIENLFYNLNRRKLSG